jgi:hypothetical protein
MDCARDVGVVRYRIEMRKYVSVVVKKDGLIGSSALVDATIWLDTNYPSVEVQNIVSSDR